jgi:hypothetical protein
MVSQILSEVLIPEFFYDNETKIESQIDLRTNKTFYKKRDKISKYLVPETTLSQDLIKNNSKEFRPIKVGRKTKITFNFLSDNNFYLKDLPILSHQDKYYLESLDFDNLTINQTRFLKNLAKRINFENDLRYSYFMSFDKANLQKIVVSNKVIYKSIFMFENGFLKLNYDFAQYCLRSDNYFAIKEIRSSKLFVFSIIDKNDFILLPKMVEADEHKIIKERIKYRQKSGGQYAGKFEKIGENL